MAGSCTASKADSTEWMSAMLLTGTFTDSNNGTVVDSNTGLRWMKCVVGQTFDPALNNCAAGGGGTVYGAKSYTFCSGPPVNGTYTTCTFTADAAKTALDGVAFDVCNTFTIAGITGWRLPTKIELEGLKSFQNRDQMLLTFPQTPDDKAIWSSSYYNTDVQADTSAWTVQFAETAFGKVTGYNVYYGVNYIKCVK